jgi:hypothetical protein
MIAQVSLNNIAAHFFGHVPSVSCSSGNGRNHRPEWFCRLDWRIWSSCLLMLISGMLITIWIMPIVSHDTSVRFDSQIVYSRKKAKWLSILSEKHISHHVHLQSNLSSRGSEKWCKDGHHLLAPFSRVSLRPYHKWTPASKCMIFSDRDGRKESAEVLMSLNKRARYICFHSGLQVFLPPNLWLECYIIFIN